MKPIKKIPVPFQKKQQLTVNIKAHSESFRAQFSLDHRKTDT